MGDLQKSIICRFWPLTWHVHFLSSGWVWVQFQFEFYLVKPSASSHFGFRTRTSHSYCIFQCCWIYCPIGYCFSCFGGMFPSSSGFWQSECSGCCGCYLCPHSDQEHLVFQTGCGTSFQNFPQSGGCCWIDYSYFLTSCYNIINLSFCNLIGAKILLNCTVEMKSCRWVSYQINSLGSCRRACWDCPRYWLFQGQRQSCPALPGSERARFLYASCSSLLLLFEAVPCFSYCSFFIFFYWLIGLKTLAYFDSLRCLTRF